MKPFEKNLCAKALMFEGSAANRAAIAWLMRKAENKGELTIGYHGASTVAGAGAPQGAGWADLTTHWWQKTFPAATIHSVNAGIGSTDVVYGAERMERDLLCKKPDLVILDFGPNDFERPHAQEAYEGIISTLFSLGIPCINYNEVGVNGHNIQELELPVNRAYGAAQISFKNSVWAVALDENAQEGYRKSEVWHTDLAHPTKRGHALAAMLIIDYLETLLAAYQAGNVKPSPLSISMPSPITQNGYFHAGLLESSDTAISPIRFLSFDGWQTDYDAVFFQLHNRGWQANKAGATLTMETRYSYLDIFFALQKEASDLEILVDDQPLKRIDFAYQGNGYTNPFHVLHETIAQKHIVKLVLRENKAVPKPWFGICAMGYGTALVK